MEHRQDDDPPPKLTIFGALLVAGTLVLFAVLRITLGDLGLAIGGFVLATALVVWGALAMAGLAQKGWRRDWMAAQYLLAIVAAVCLGLSRLPHVGPAVHGASRALGIIFMLGVVAISALVPSRRRRSHR